MKIQKKKNILGGGGQSEGSGLGGGGGGGGGSGWMCTKLKFFVKIKKKKF